MAVNIWAAAKDGDTAALARLLHDCEHVGTPACGSCTCWPADGSMLAVPVDARDANGSTALMYACEKGRLDAAALLLRHGACVNSVDKFGDTALLFAASWAHVDVVTLLLSRGADPNIPDMERDTALIVAAGEGHIDVCVHLLRCGAGVGHVNETGWAPAHAAIANNRSRALELLLRSGGDLDGAQCAIPRPWLVWREKRDAGGVMNADTLRGVVGAARGRGGSASDVGGRTAGVGVDVAPGAFITLAVTEAAHACVPVLVAHYLWHRRRPFLLLREALHRDGGELSLAPAAGSDPALSAFAAAAMLPRELYKRIVAFL